MKINKNNYEEYFIDYYDGNLTAEQTAELFLFLESHPDLKLEFNNFSDVRLEIPQMQFPDRNSLMKADVTTTNIDEQLVAALEGDSSEQEQQALKEFLQQHPAFEKDRTLYSATVSIPDLNIVYPEKKSLKKPVPFFAAYRSEIRYGIAAILLLGFIAGMVAVFNRTMERNTIQVAEEKNLQHQPSSEPGNDVNKIASPGDADKVDPEGQKKENLTAPSTPTLKDVQNNQIPAQEKSNNPSGQPVKDATGLNQDPVQLAATVPVTPITGSTDSVTLAAPAPSSLQAVNPTSGNSNEKFLTVWEAIRQSSEKSLKKFVEGEEPVMAYADEQENEKPSLADVVSKGIEKVSRDKIKLDTDKQSRDYSFSAGKFKIERK